MRPGLFQPKDSRATRETGRQSAFRTPHSALEWLVSLLFLSQLGAWAGSLDTNQPVGRAADSSTRTHWAFQPLAPVRLPKVSDRSWPKTGIDHFILERL